jgi:hypothetical protein
MKGGERAAVLENTFRPQWVSRNRRQPLSTLSARGSKGAFRYAGMVFATKELLAGPMGVRYGKGKTALG